ncbi:synaptotagmin-7-like isoform X4, partial [Biomphalaria glabrata]
MCIRCIYKLFGLRSSGSEDDILQAKYPKEKLNSGELRNGQTRYGGTPSPRHNMELSDRTKQIKKDVYERALKEKALP